MADLSIIDSSALIAMKTHVAGGDQWAAFRQLEDLTVAGHVTLVRHVIREMAEVMHPDVPGVWAQGVRDLVQYPLDPDYDVLAEVMANAGDVVDPQKTEEDADPYVLALGLQLARDGIEVEVVTQDCVDRQPIRIAMTTAAARLNIDCVDLGTFLDDLDIPWRAP